MNQVERVARAMLRDELNGSQRDFDNVWEDEKEAWLANAASAIAAFHDPAAGTLKSRDYKGLSGEIAGSPAPLGALADEVAGLTRPIIGIEHRSNDEVFAIMRDHIRRAATRLAAREAEAERRGMERAAVIADQCARRADRVEIINAFGVEAATNTVKLCEGIATAIRAASVPACDGGEGK